MVSSIAKYRRSTEVGLFFNLCGEVIIDTPFPKAAKMLRSVAGGDVLVRSVTGDICFLAGLAAGELFPFECTEVISSGLDWEGNSRTTTATDIYWFVGDP